MRQYYFKISSYNLKILVTSNCVGRAINVLNLKFLHIHAHLFYNVPNLNRDTLFY